MSDLQLNSTSADPAMLGAPIHIRKERDFYPTIDADVTHAIARFLLAEGLLTAGSIVWEPACGDWAMGKVLDTYFGSVIGSDIEPKTKRGIELDFLTDPQIYTDAIITNPPYGSLATSFIERGLEFMRNGIGGNTASVVAMLARNELDSASTRKHLFGDCPEFYAKLVLTWRPRWVANSTGAPRHNYAWFVWSTKRQGGARIFYTGKRHDSFGADTNCANELPL